MNYTFAKIWLSIVAVVILSALLYGIFHTVESMLFSLIMVLLPLTLAAAEAIACGKPKNKK